MANPQNQYQQLALAAAKAYGLDPHIFMNQIAAESNWNPNAKSGAGAEGIAQFMPATAKGMGVNPYDPRSALYGAAKMDAGNLKKYGSYESMLSAYNSGNANAWKDPNFAHGETANYVKKIMGGMSPYVAAGGTAPPANDMRNQLLQYVMQSNTAQMNHTNAPSLLSLFSGGTTSGPSLTPNIPAPQGGGAGMKLVGVPDGFATKSGIQLNAPVASTAEALAKQFGVKINSGYRSPAHNAAVGGAENSDHLSGNAVDFTGSAAAMRALYAYAQKQGYAYIEPWSQTGGSHVHISFIR